MKTERLNSWLTLGANVGVLIGLILLVYELRQNTDMMKSQMSQSRGDSASELLGEVMDSPFLPEILVKLDGEEELTEVESVRYMYYCRSVLKTMENYYWQYQQGFLGDEVPRSIAFIVKIIIGRGEIGLEIWDTYKFQHSDDFVAFVEEAIADLR